MKTLVTLAPSFLWTGYLAAVVFLLSSTGDLSELELLLFVCSSMIIMMTSIFVVASLISNVADPSTPSGRRYYRRLGIALAVAIVLSSALTLVTGLVNGRPPWVLAVLIVGAIIVALGSVAAAERYRRGLPTNTDDHWMPVPSSFRSKAARRAAVTFAIAAAVTAIALVVVEGLIGGRFGVPRIILMSVGFGAIVAAVPGFGPMMRLSSSINNIFGSDIDSRRVVTRVVVRSKPDQLSADQERMAASFALAMSDYMPLLFGQIVLLLLGTVLTQLPLALDTGISPLGGAIVGVFVVAYLIIFPRFFLQLRSIRRYAAVHSEAAVRPELPS